MVKQISIFLENKKGRLARACRVLGDANVNIRALSIADTADFGLLRLIVNDPEKAYAVLKEKGFTANITDVLAIKVPDRPNGLAEVLESLDQADINVEYMYAFIGSDAEDALVIIRVENAAALVEVIERTGVQVLRENELYAL